MPRGRSKAGATDWLRRNRLKQSPRPRGNDSRLTEAFAFSDFFGEAPERRPWITEHDDAGRSLPGFIFAFVFYWLELPTDCAIEPTMPGAECKSTTSLFMFRGPNVARSSAAMCIFQQPRDITTIEKRLGDSSGSQFPPQTHRPSRRAARAFSALASCCSSCKPIRMDSRRLGSMPKA